MYTEFIKTTLEYQTNINNKYNMDSAYSNVTMHLHFNEITFKSDHSVD